MKIGALFLGFAAATPCPSTTCWTWDASQKTCTLNGSCVTVTCTDTQMVMGAKEAVLGTGNWGSSQISGWSSTPDSNGFYTTDCDLSTGANDCGAPSFENIGGIDNLVFTFELIQHGNVRVRTAPKSDEIDLDGGATKLITSPHGVGVTFKCYYDATVSVSAADFVVTPVSIAGTYSSTGTLDSGFHLTVGPSPIILGDIVTVTATWDVTIASVSYHFSGCNVSHGNSGVDIIRDGCIATLLGVTTPANGVYNYKTFHIDGETGTTQKMTCSLTICNGSSNCAKASTCPNNSGYGFA